MIEVKGNLWTYPADVRVITTNGTVKKNGECVMGRGCALEAKKKFPGLALTLGLTIKGLGNEAFWIQMEGESLVTFPVKHNWFERADIYLIEASAIKIAGMNALKGKFSWIKLKG